MALVTKGGGITRTKHLKARMMNLGKEMVDKNRVKIVHVNAPMMKADGFSRPYDPADHKSFAKMIQKEKQDNADNRWVLKVIEQMRMEE